MAEQADEISEQEKQTRNEMLFTLSERDRGTLAMAITPNEWKRKEVYHFLKEHLKEYSFVDLDLTSHTYTSLYRALQELLPQLVLQSQPVQYVVSVIGLESSLYKTDDGRIEFSSLVAQLNFERELIFNQPYIILLWISEGFDKELQKKAPDLMHWMSKRFVFEETGSDGMEVAEAAIEYGAVRKKGKIPERLERIRQLEETWENLCLYNEDRERLIRDKINLLRLLGKEYAAAFDLSKAEEAFRKAIMLNKKTSVGSDGFLLYELGNIYAQFNRYDLALEYFLPALEYAEKYRVPDPANVYHMLGVVYDGLRNWKEALKSYQKSLDAYKKNDNADNIGQLYHQIGYTYQQQKNWVESLKNYRQSLEWKIKTGNEQAIGSTYHQLGRVYEEQGKWEEALANYQRALEWNRKTGNEYELGGNYHGIGMVYEKQGKWDDALKNYQEALEWRIKTGNEYEVGSGYHQIGQVYGQQGKWDESLKNYCLALEWKLKTGNEYKAGITYLGIGHVEEVKGDLLTASEFYQKAVDNQRQYDKSYLPVSEQALERVLQKLEALQSPNS
jgi:tetratricopeptide (TPR) repeat protein